MFMRILSVAVLRSRAVVDAYMLTPNRIYPQMIACFQPSVPAYFYLSESMAESRGRKVRQISLHNAKRFEFKKLPA